MTKVDEIKKKVEEFQSLQSKWSGRGAYDTEPDWQFQNVIRKAIQGEKKIPQTPNGWELYSYNDEENMLSTPAANELAEKAGEVADFILALPLGESKEVIEYLKDYCWRVDI